MDDKLYRVNTAVPAVLVLCALLSACQVGSKTPSQITGNVEPPPRFMQAVSTCRATKAKPVLGHVVNQHLLEEAMQRAGAQTARTVLPGEASASVYDGTRLNVDVDAGGRAIALRCG